MEASHKTHRPHIKVGKDEEEEEEMNSEATYLTCNNNCTVTSALQKHFSDRNCMKKADIFA